MKNQFTNCSVAADYSLEIGVHDIGDFAQYRHKIPQNGRIYVNAVAGAGPAERIKTVVSISKFGFRPVPHIAARRFPSVAVLDDYLARLADAGVDELLIVGGDVPAAPGPFASALQIIESGMPEKYGIGRIGIAGYPDGHPTISNEILRDSLLAKIGACIERNIDPYVVTQFSFEAQSIIRWCREFHSRHPDTAVHAGIPGPARLATLLRFARICGVRSSAKKLLKNSKVGLDLLRSAAPSKQLIAIGQYRSDTGYDVSAHIFTFGGIKEVINWLEEFNCGDGADRALNF